jgi:lysophospholipase L1-like esterase
VKKLAVFVLALAPCLAQTSRPLLSNREANQLFEKVVNLMETTSAAAPELARAGAPALEKARTTLRDLQFLPQNAALTYDFLSSLRSWVALADALPKPFPYPEESGRQAAELGAAAGRIEAHLRALLDQKERQLRNPDRDNLRRYAEADEKLPPPAPAQPRVVFLGDSITDGWRLNEYFAGRDFVNRGISGQITGEMLGRMQADVIALKPKAMIVLAGTNDIARGVSVGAIENNLTMIADLADYHQIKPLFASVLPISDYHKDVNPSNERSKQRPPATILELNRWLRDFCERRHFAYVDYFPALVDQAGFLQADLAEDGLHPNAKGYRLMAPIALAAIDKAVAPEPAVKKRGRK